MSITGARAAKLMKLMLERESAAFVTFATFVTRVRQDDGGSIDPFEAPQLLATVFGSRANVLTNP